MDLLELAERCEKASGPNPSLDEAIMDAIFDRQAFVQLADAPEGTGFNSWIDGSGRRTSAYRFTASLDAAMTLADGLGGEVTLYKDGTAKAFIWQPYPMAIEAKAATPALALCAAKAATPALALCAAALRARALPSANNRKD